MRSISGGWSVDDLGPMAVHFQRLPMDAECVVFIDNVTLGWAFGGVRLNDSVTVGEVVHLARAMTVKNAVAGVPHGGGKAGIRVTRPLTGSDREPVVRAFAQAIRCLVDYVPGPDMGTDEMAMAWIHNEIGRAVGLPAVISGIPLDDVGATGYGLAVCAESLETAGVVKIDGARVAVQGFGAVGQHAALQLAKRGARVVTVSDSTGAVHRPDGLDVSALVAAKRTRPVAQFADGEPIGRDDLVSVACDVLVPAAQACFLHEGNVDRVCAWCCRARTWPSPPAPNRCSPNAASSACPTWWPMPAA